jgi:hypothetical protein
MNDTPGQRRRGAHHSPPARHRPPPDGRAHSHEALLEAKNRSQTGRAPPAATRDVGFIRWTQYLKFTEVGHAIYFDEGNGEAMLK